MTSLLTAIVLFSTVVLAGALGVASGYLIISGILNMFAHKPEAAKPSAPVMATSGVAGD